MQFAPFSLLSEKILWEDTGESCVPPNVRKEFFPVANATEALFLFWYITARPNRKTIRQLFALLKHPDFKLEDVPAETDLIQMPLRLPLLPAYYGQDGKGI